MLEYLVVKLVRNLFSKEKQKTTAHKATEDEQTKDDDDDDDAKRRDILNRSF